MQDNPFMSLAMEQARLAAQKGEVPVGAVLIDASGQCVSSAHNLVETTHDPTAHAELLVIREASQLLHTPRLSECDLYVTLEPCAMCAQAIAFARIRRLYYAADDPKGGGVKHGSCVFSHATCHHKPELYDGIGRAESVALLKKFFQSLRK